MLLSDVFVILVLLLIAWLWWQDRGFKQSAFAKCKTYCAQAGVELLDDNIQIKQLRLRKNSKGQWRLYRHFEFEFTSTYEQRYKGKLETLGRQIINIELGAHRI